MKSAAYCLFETPLGRCGIAWRTRCGQDGRPIVTGFQLPEATAADMERDAGVFSESPPPGPIAALIERVRRHLAGDCEDFTDVEVDVDGVGAFAQQVYTAIRRIPAGQTRTYGEIAQSLSRAGAARAVGQALGENPIPLIIPCHRVLAAGGKPGGFSAPGGVATKLRMLAIEGVAGAPPPKLKSADDLIPAAARPKPRD